MPMPRDGGEMLCALAPLFKSDDVLLGFIGFSAVFIISYDRLYVKHEGFLTMESL